VQDAKTVGVPVRYFDVTKGVPHVVLVRDGRVLDEHTGPLGTARLKGWVEKATGDKDG
jgi:thioredoxin-like negative regulator of GroEL